MEFNPDSMSWMRVSFANPKPRQQVSIFVMRRLGIKRNAGGLDLGGQRQSQVMSGEIKPKGEWLTRAVKLQMHTVQRLCSLSSALYRQTLGLISHASFHSLFPLPFLTMSFPKVLLPFRQRVRKGHWISSAPANSTSTASQGQAAKMGGRGMKQGDPSMRCTTTWNRKRGEKLNCFNEER